MSTNVDFEFTKWEDDRASGSSGSSASSDDESQRSSPGVKFFERVTEIIRSESCLSTQVVLDGCTAPDVAALLLGRFNREGFELRPPIGGPLDQTFKRSFPESGDLRDRMHAATVTSLQQEDRPVQGGIFRAIASMAFAKMLVELDLRKELVERTSGGSSVTSEGRYLFRQFYKNFVGVKIVLPKLTHYEMFQFMLFEERFKFVAKLANNAWRSAVRETRISPHSLGIEDKIANVRYNLHEGIFDYCATGTRPTVQMLSLFGQGTSTKVEQAVEKSQATMERLDETLSTTQQAMSEFGTLAATLKSQIPAVAEAAQNTSATANKITSIIEWIKDLAPVALGVAVVLIAMWNFYWPSITSKVLLGVVTTMSFGIVGLKIWKQFPLVLKALTHKEKDDDESEKSSVYSVNFDSIEDELPMHLREAQNAILRASGKAKAQGGVEVIEFASAIAAIVGVFGFVADTGGIVKKISGLAAAKKGIDVIVEVVLSIIVFIAPTVKQWTGIDLVSKLYPDDGLKDFLLEAQETLAKAKHGVLPVLDDQLNALYRLITAGHDIAMRLKKDKKEPLLAYLTPVMKELTKLHDTVKERLMSAKKAPIIPVYICLFGTRSGTGKSTAANALEEALKIKCCEDPSKGIVDLDKLASWNKSKKPYVHFTNGDKWDDGLFNSTELVRINEAFSKSTTPGMENSDAERIIKWVNPEELSVQFSSVEQKGTTGVRPKFILATSNVCDFSAQKQIVNPQAIVRRTQDGIDDGTVIWFDKLSAGNSDGFDPMRLNMFIAKRVDGSNTMAFEKGPTPITFSELVHNCCRAYERNHAKGLRQADDFRIQAQKVMDDYYRERSLPKDTASKIDEAMDQFDDIFAQGAGSDPIEVVETPVDEDAGVAGYLAARTTFMTRNLMVDDDRMGYKDEHYYAFDAYEGDHTGKTIIDYTTIMRGEFGTLDPNSTLVKTYAYLKPVFMQMRGFAIRYKKNTATVCEMEEIRSSDTQSLPPQEEVGDKKHFFTLGKMTFSLDKAYERSFLIREMFLQDTQFIGHAIFFQGTVGVAKAELRIKVAEKFGLHSWYPSARIVTLLRRWGYKHDHVKLPFWSWRIQLSIEHPEWAGISIGHDSFAFATWVLDSVLEIGVAPVFIFNYLKRHVPQLAGKSREQVKSILKQLDISKLQCVTTTAAFAQTTWDKLKMGLDYLRNKMWEAAQKVWKFFTDHAALILTVTSVIATAIGVFYGLSSSSEVTIQSGAGTRAYTRKVQPGRVTQRSVSMKKAVLQLGDQKTISIRAMIQAGSYALSVKNIDGATMTKVGYVQFVQGRTAIMNAHVARAIMHRRGVLAEHEITEDVFQLKQDEKIINFGPDDVEIASFGESDLATITFKNTSLVREHPNLEKHFMIAKAQAVYHHSGPKSNLVNCDSFECSTTTCGGTSIEFDTKGSNEKIQIDQFYGYDIKTGDGDCGSMLMTADGTTGGQILGMHVAGDNKANGFAFKISREDLRFALHGLDSKDFETDDDLVAFEKAEVVAQGNLPYDASVHTGIVKTFCAPLPSGVHSKTKKTKFTGTTELPKEYTTAMSNCAPKFYGNARSTYVETNATVDRNLMYLIGQHIGSVHRSHSKLGNGMLSLSSAIQGEVNSALKSIDSSTSAGYPWSAQKIGKDQFYSIDERGKVIPGPLFPVLLARIKIIMACLLRGADIDLLFTDNLKDERRKIQKVLDGKSRLVSASPLELTIITRMLFGSYMESIQSSPIKSGTAIGLNPYSIDWDSLAKQMRAKCGSEARCTATDYKGWDGHLNENIGQALFGSTDKFYEGAPEDECVARRTVLRMFFRSQHIRGGVIEQWATDIDGKLVGFGWPSGNPLTAPGNSDMNLATFCYHYVTSHDGDVSKIPEFFKLVMIIVLGDDNMLAVSKGLEKMFAEPNVAKTVAIMGMEMTSDSKGELSEELRTLEEVSLIKRKFRFEPYVGRWVAPLDLDVVIEQCMWTQSSSYLATAIQNLNVTVRELSLHGREVFYHWLPLLRKYYGQHFRVDCEVWESVLQTTLQSTIFSL